MLRCRNYWCYSAGTAIAWAVLLILVRTIDLWQGESAAHPIGRFRRLYMLGVGDDCPIFLSAAKSDVLNKIIRITIQIRLSECWDLHPILTSFFRCSLSITPTRFIVK
jgi:hypothetical protein